MSDNKFLLIRSFEYLNSFLEIGHLLNKKTIVQYSQEMVFIYYKTSLR